MTAETPTALRVANVIRNLYALKVYAQLRSRADRLRFHLVRGILVFNNLPRGFSRFGGRTWPRRNCGAWWPSDLKPATTHKARTLGHGRHPDRLLCFHGRHD